MSILNHFHACLLRDNSTAKQFEGLTIEKNKFPPIDNAIPTLVQWKKTANGQEHVNSRDNQSRNQNKSDEILAQILELKRDEIASKSSPVPPAMVSVTTPVAPTTIATTTNRFENGFIRIFTRDGIEPTDIGFGSNRDFQYNSNVWSVLKTIRTHVACDKNTEERVFRIDTASGTKPGFSVEQMKKETIESLFTLAFKTSEPGQCLTIYSGKRNKTENIEIEDGNLTD